MKWLGYKPVALKAIHVDAVDIRKRVGTQHVKDLADDVQANGGEYIHAPTVRADSNAILCGRDRLAAAVLRKIKKLWVHVAECDDDEAKALELSENIYRRPLDKDSRAQAVAALVKLREQQYRAEDDARRAAGEKVSAAPANTPIARARRQVAKAAGVGHATVVSHEKHARKSAEQAENVTNLPGEVTRVETPLAALLPDGFRAFGLEVPDAQKDRIRTTAAWLSQMESDARRILGELTKLEKDGRPVAHARIQAIREAGQALSHAIREAIPTSLCFYCKARGELVTACNACGQTGVVGRHGGDHAPPELKRTDVVHVAIDGQMVPIGGSPAVPAPKTSGRAKKIRVEDEQGRELAYEPDPSDGDDERVPL